MQPRRGYTLIVSTAFIEATLAQLHCDEHVD